MAEGVIVSVVVPEGVLVVEVGVIVGVVVAFVVYESSFEMLVCWACWLYLPASVSESMAAAMIERWAIILMRFILDKKTGE